MPTPSPAGHATNVTPAMRQYLDAKQQYRDAILFFRMGDFYEMFYEDALVAARALDLTLTSRSRDGQGTSIPMCGVPHHALDTYLARLVKKGFRVAICDQVEDPRKAKGIVKREVVRVVSPGTLTDTNYLDAREPAFLMAIAPGPGSDLGVALLDLSTGEFSAAEYSGAEGAQALGDELAVLKPREVVVPSGEAPDRPATDVLARWHRQAGDDTWLLTGTDEHGQKILRTATANGVEPQQWADQLVESAWKPLLDTVDIANDDFIRTTEPRHEKAVAIFLQKLHDAHERICPRAVYRRRQGSAA